MKDSYSLNIRDYFTNKKIITIILISLIFITAFALNPFHSFIYCALYTLAFFISSILYIMCEYTEFTIYCINKGATLKISEFQKLLAVIALILAVFCQSIILNVNVNGVINNIIVSILSYIDAITVAISFSVLGDNLKFTKS